MKLPKTSTVVIENAGWTVEVTHSMLHGEPEIETKVLEDMEKQCQSLVEFPIDMSEEAFRYVYGTKLPKPEPWESRNEARQRIWCERRDAYNLTVPARTVCIDEQPIELGEPYVSCGEIHIPFSLSVNDMTTDMAYLYSIDLTAAPKISAKAMPDWVFEWSMDGEAADAWAKNPADFNDAGTLNLINAVRALQGDRIYDEGMFTRQINLVFAKSEMLTPDIVRETLIAEFEAASQPDTASEDEQKSNSGDIGQIFNIFKKGEK